MTASTGDVLWNGINLNALVSVLYCSILSHVLSRHFGNIAYCIAVEYDTNTYSGGELLLSTAVDENIAIFVCCCPPSKTEFFVHLL